MADAVMARLRQREAERRALLCEEAMRDLSEDAAAVAHLRVGADGAAMVEVLEDLQTLLDDGVGAAVMHVGDEADAAGILLPRRVVQPLGLRQSVVAHVDRRPAIASGRKGRLEGSELCRCGHARHPRLNKTCPHASMFRAPASPDAEVGQCRAGVTKWTSVRKHPLPTGSTPALAQAAFALIAVTATGFDSRSIVRTRILRGPQATPREHRRKWDSHAVLTRRHYSF